MNDDLRTSAVQWATQLELAIKKASSIRDYEINIDLTRSTSFIGEIDGRGRWGNHLHTNKSVTHLFQVRAFFNNGQQAFVQDSRHFGNTNQTPEDIINRLLDASIQVPAHDEEGVFNQRLHLNQNQEIFDPRFSRVDGEMRRELLLEHVNMMRQMNPKARVHKLELIEQELFRHNRTSINNFIEHEHEIKIKTNEEFFKPTTAAKKSLHQNNNLITPTLAEVYLKQGHFDKAIKAYEKLILKYPQKSTFFAEKIKLIKNQK